MYVGYGEGALGILDVATGRKLGDISLRGHPESFRLEESGTRIFVNVPNANHTISLLDRVKRSTITTREVQAQGRLRRRRNYEGMGTAGPERSRTARTRSAAFRGSL